MEACKEVMGKTVRPVGLYEAQYSQTFSVCSKEKREQSFSCQGLILRYVTLDLQR